MKLMKSHNILNYKFKMLDGNYGKILLKDL